jgi:hypothetical protein
MRWHDRCQPQTPGRPARHRAVSVQMKVSAMTTTQPRRSFTRLVTAPIRAFRHLNGELTGAGAAIAGSNRFPQPRPQADLAEAKRVHPASAGKVLAGV